MSFRNQGVCEGSPHVEDTSLLKPVPYDDMDKDEKVYIESHIKRRKDEDPNWGTTEYEVVNLIPYYKLVGFNTGDSDVKVGPVLQVKTISLFNNSDNWNGSDIYGQVLITDHKENAFCIYKREAEDSEVVSPEHNVLSLSSCPMAPVIRGEVSFTLFTSRDDALIFSGSSYVEYSIEDDECIEVKENQLTVVGKCGYYAKMDYSIIPFAVIGRIGMRLIVPPDPIGDPIFVEGYVKANNLCCLRNKQLKVSKSPEPKTVYKVELSRNAIAVPVTSSLVFDVFLTRDGEEYAVGVGKINPIAFESFFQYVDCNVKDHYFRMLVDWMTPEEFFGLLPKKQKPVTSMDDDNYAEIFSVSIGGGGSAPVSICGTIVVRDRDETVYIFSRNDKCQDNRTWLRKTVSLTWPGDRWVLEKNFFMHLKLKDVHGNLVCRGGFDWWHDDSDKNPMRFDRRMCAVIPGKDGHFAAVHYSIFRNGLRAKVTVTVEFMHPCDFFDVYGSVYAEYSNYDYSSAYDKTYYRIIIFKRPEEERAKVHRSCKIPLSKSLITAPSDCARLIVHVNMLLRPIKDDLITVSPNLSAMGKLRFKAGTDASRQLSMRYCVDGVSCAGRVMVNVEWFKSSHGSQLTGRNSSTLP